MSSDRTLHIPWIISVVSLFPFVYMKVARVASPMLTLTVLSWWLMLLCFFCLWGHAQIQGTGVPDPPPPEKYKIIGFLNNTGPDPLANHKATKPAFNVGPSSARQQNAIKMASGSDITLCNKIDKPLVVNRFSGSVMTSSITLRKIWQNFDVFTPKMRF